VTFRVNNLIRYTIRWYQATGQLPRLNSSTRVTKLFSKIENFHPLFVTLPGSLSPSVFSYFHLPVVNLCLVSVLLDPPRHHPLFSFALLLDRPFLPLKGLIFLVLHLPGLSSSASLFPGDATLCLCSLSWSVAFSSFFLGLSSSNCPS